MLDKRGLKVTYKLMCRENKNKRQRGKEAIKREYLLQNI